MGLFDLFRKKDGASADERELLRLQKLSLGKLSQDPDRPYALERLSAMGTAASARILLQRFNWHLDPSIRDHEEKDIALEGIVRVGEPAVKEVLRFCAKAESLTWPFKALRRLVSPERFEQELLSLLDQFDTDYQRNPEPKIQLLQTLTEFSSAETQQAVQPFLEDSNEAVRFTAASTLFGIGSAVSAPALVEALVTDESLRIRNRIAQGLIERGWEVPEAARERLAASLPPGVALRGAVLSGAVRA